MWGKGQCGAGITYSLVLCIINRIKYGYGRTYLPTQQTRQKRTEEKKKKPLVLTLGSPPKKGGKKKPWY